MTSEFLAPEELSLNPLSEAAAETAATPNWQSHHDRYAGELTPSPLAGILTLLKSMTQSGRLARRAAPRRRSLI